jgi:ORF6N domain
LEFSRSFRRFILRYSVREISDSSTEEMKLALKPENIAQLVFFVRGEKVMFDADLAKLYGVSTKALNQALRRNRDRFADDFVFQLTAEEFAFLKSRSVTSNAEEPHSQGLRPNWSQFVTSSRKHRGARYRPYAFTEQGVAMLSSVLRSRVLWKSTSLSCARSSSYAGSWIQTATWPARSKHWKRNTTNNSPRFSPP